MKHIIIILLIILIVVFTAKKSIEYRKEKMEETCDYNCGKHKTEGECLSCENCGVCKLVDNDKVTTYCLPGDASGSFFNEQCKGNVWTFRGETGVTVNPTIVLTNEPKKYTSSGTSYTDILKAMGQNIEVKNNVSGSNKQIGTQVIEEEDKKIGETSATIETKSYDDILTELDNLTKFFK